ncbi:PREDICTED: uncharacterized protein LOC109160653 [Ipomoea nil]|uniref:uncharacterized protein LOC109160653 n=1 Tax=Ipomoea nil TaxID=35883 RepID=UPI00090188FF|nr:PREDICTED: uncharacterized protein LOC109160653 [Ipomoea nil]
MVPASGVVVATTELRNDSHSSNGPAQLTIFYAGSVSVYSNVSPEKAQAIMLLAGNGKPAASPAQGAVLPRLTMNWSTEYIDNYPLLAPSIWVSWLVILLDSEILKKKPKKGSKNAKPVTKTEHRDSFFNFISTPEVPEDEDDIDEAMRTASMYHSLSFLSILD